MSLHPWDNDLVCQDATKQLMCVIEACHYSREMQLMARNYTIQGMLGSGYNCSINITISEETACEREIPNCIEDYFEKLNTSYEVTSGAYKYCPFVDTLYRCMSNFYCNYVEISNAIRNITFHDLYSRGILCEIDLYRNETEPTPVMDCAAATNRCQEYFEGNLTLHYGDKPLVCQDATNHLLCVFAGCNYSPSMQQNSINLTRQTLATSGYYCDINITVVSPCLKDAPQCIENHLSMLQNSTDATSGNNQYCPGVDKLYMCLSYLNCGYDEITNLVSSETSRYVQLDKTHASKYAKVNGISYYDLRSRGILCDVDLDQGGQMSSTTMEPVTCETGSSSCQANFTANMNAHYWSKDLVCEDATTYLTCMFTVCNYSPAMQEYTINATLQGLSNANYNCNLNLTITSPCQINKQTCIENYLDRLSNSDEAKSGFGQPCPMTDYMYMCLAQYNCDLDEIYQAFNSITSYQLYNRGIYCGRLFNIDYIHEQYLILDFKILLN
ncbi:uncharacterized protein LOC131937050 [Physella acuta]|uniref:uncharacterized protein LOC131937050 n=1 Tax=Physella acuta TaxID=109671 RepID=UPI0027DB3217|nr:uncharacterized protein LOC131937050 [Physella acuta]